MKPDSRQPDSLRPSESPVVRDTHTTSRLSRVGGPIGEEERWRRQQTLKRQQEEEAAAVRLQAAARGRATRSSIAAKRRADEAPHAEHGRGELCRALEEEAAIVRIQAAARGRAARSCVAAKQRMTRLELLQMQQDQAKIVTNQVAQSEGTMIETWTQRSSAADTQRIAEEEAAAVRLQAAVRGRAARSSAVARRRAADASDTEEQQHSRSRPGEEDRLDSAQRSALSAKPWADKSFDPSMPPKADTLLQPVAPPGKPSPGGRGRSGQQFTPRPPTDPEFVLSEVELRRRAQISLDKTADKMNQSIPSIANCARPFAGLPKLKLEDLPPTAQGAFLRVARYEAEEWLKQERGRRAWEIKQVVKQTVQSKKLEEWYKRKEQFEEEERKRTKKQERDDAERERLKEEKRTQRNEAEKNRLGDYLVEKDARERQNAAATEKAAKAEEERRRKVADEYRSRQKAKLDDWYRETTERKEREAQEAEERLKRQKEEEQRKEREEQQRLARLTKSKRARRHLRRPVDPPPGCEIYAKHGLPSMTPRVH